jgi:hypothetical protein
VRSRAAPAAGPSLRFGIHAFAILTTLLRAPAFTAGARLHCAVRNTSARREMAPACRLQGRREEVFAMKKFLFAALIGLLAIGGACGSDRTEAIASAEQHAEGGKKTYEDIKDADFEAVAKKNSLPIQKDGNGNKYVDYEADSPLGKIKLRFTLLPGNKIEVKIRDKPRLVSDDKIFKEVDKQIDEAKKKKDGKCAELGDSCNPDDSGDSGDPGDRGDPSDDDDFIDFIPPESVWEDLTEDLPCDDVDCGGGDPEIGSTTEPMPEPVRARAVP